MQNSKRNQKPTKISQSESWEKAIKRYLITRKKIHAMSYQDISNRLVSCEIHQSAQNLSAKFNTGKLSAASFASSLIAMGEKDIDLSELEMIFKEIEENDS